MSFEIFCATLEQVETLPEDQRKPFLEPILQIAFEEDWFDYYCDLVIQNKYPTFTQMCLDDPEHGEMFREEIEYYKE